MTAHTLGVTFAVTGTRGIAARSYTDGSAALDLGPGSLDPRLHFTNPDVIDKVINALLDARRMLAPDDPVNVVALEPVDVGERLAPYTPDGAA